MMPSASNPPIEAICICLGEWTEFPINLLRNAMFFPERDWAVTERKNPALRTADDAGTVSIQ
jgi:hypothetical protein